MLNGAGIKEGTAINWWQTEDHLNKYTTTRFGYYFDSAVLAVATYEETPNARDTTDRRNLSFGKKLN